MLSTLAMKTRLICTDGGSNKFWEGHVDGSALHLRWGRIGTNGQSKTKPFADAPSAERELQKLVTEKLRSGYQRDDDGELAPTPAAAGAPVAAPAPEKKPKKKAKRRSLSLKAARSLMENGDVDGIIAALEKDASAAESFGPGITKLFAEPSTGTTPELAQDRRKALLALLDAGLDPSLAACGITETTWILDSAQKAELLATHWNKLDAGAKKQVLSIALWVPSSGAHVDRICSLVDVKTVIAWLEFYKLTGLHLERNQALFAYVEAMVSRFTGAELDQVSDQRTYATWLMGTRELVYDKACGAALVHKAAAGAVPALMTLLLERGANPAFTTAQPTQWTIPDSTPPAQSGEYAVIEIPAGATALDVATRCHDELATLAAKHARGRDKLRETAKPSFDKARAEQTATLERYQQIITMLEGRGLAASTRAASPGPTYDVAAALEQYLALCAAIGQSTAEHRARAASVEAPASSVLAYWRDLAEDNEPLIERLAGEGLAGLVMDSKEFYDDSYLSGEAADIADRGDLLHALDADAWYDVDGVVFHVHPEGASRVGTYAECMTQLRERLASDA